MKRLLLIVIGLSIICSSFAQALMVDTALYTIEQFMEEKFSESSYHIGDLNFTGNPNSLAYFKKIDSTINFPFQEGILLTTGYAEDALGPNDSDSVSGYTNGGSDSLLAALLVDTIFDAAALEFVYTPFSENLEISYIFASEEYPEHIDSLFNDGFGIFITGPGYQNFNIATLPNTSTPISINTINPNSNDSFYIANTQNSNEAIQFDGYTIPIVAKAQVMPGTIYHIKIVIGDLNNPAYDSAIFLEKISSVGEPEVTMANYDQFGQEVNEIVEGNSYRYVFSRLDTTNLTEPKIVFLNIFGTATVVMDISGFPSSLQIPAGQVSTIINYSVTADNESEGIENLIFVLLNAPCGHATDNQEVDTIWIIDSLLSQESIVTDHLIKLYPNPVRSILHIETPETILNNYEIYSINGMLLLHGELRKDESEINISALPSGTYFIRIKNQKHFIIRPFEVL
jgi:hypothetical protein